MGTIPASARSIARMARAAPSPSSTGIMMSMRMAVKAARRGGDEAVDGLLTILGGGDERAALFEHIGRDLAVEGIVLGHEEIGRAHV